MLWCRQSSHLERNKQRWYLNQPLYIGCDAMYAWKRVISSPHASVKPVYIAAACFIFTAEGFTIAQSVMDIWKQAIIFCSSL